MKLLLSSLLLASLCDLSSWSVSSTGTLVVTQTPHVTVMEGDPVNITCCWTGMSDRVGVNWLKNQIKMENKTDIISNTSKGSLQKETRTCSKLTFTNITREDSDIYFCKVSVEIPFLTEFKGDGTVITVVDRANKTDNKEEDSSPEENSSGTNASLPMIIALAVVCPILLLTLIPFCILQRKRAIAVRVIYEVPHIDSEVADVDKHSTTSSRGSTQWCQVPVYESVDYFEQTERKPSQ